ncbi:MmcQ/YjbR family DNA-binding protein [Nakamurella deserti]|uniref:MmcQ/YjbR family DNA-binding protein n=1 Tax=Nakamurella deserti TaxID=2164074 RepID=UPI000DBE5BE8|nr:MmcQ/YjbR family DNA-binding protein [Nakamurella deserti]
MDHHLLLAYCTGRPGAEQAETSAGHDEVTVGGQAFAVFGPEVGTVTLKCGRDADEAQWWRDAYPDDVLIAPYVGQYGWNTFALSADIDDAEFHRAVDVSYADVVERQRDAGTSVSGEATS